MASSDYYDYYGAKVPKTLEPLEREFHFIQKGGKWKNKYGKVIGNGLAFHFLEAIKIIWPEVVQHRWFTLFVEEWLTHKFIGVMGPKNTGKSLNATVCHLVDYYAFPSSTTVLICSTTKERLEDRIWGEIKKYHRLARQRFPNVIPGHLIEGRQRIVTDDRDEVAEGRDFRNGLMGVPCFLSGTMVDTPCGQSPIETVRVGDVVLNATGVGRVRRTFCNTTRSLVRVRLSDGRFFDCTPEHPFLTHRGWVNASCLKTFDMVYSAHETVRILREGDWTGLPESEILYSRMPRLSTTKALQTMREMVSCCESKTHLEEHSLVGQVLQPSVCWKVGKPAQRMLDAEDLEMFHVWEDDGRSTLRENLLLCQVSKPSGSPSMPTMRSGVRFYPRISKERTHSFLRRLLQEESDWTEELSQECFSNSGGACCVEAIPGINLSLPPENRNEASGWFCPLVSAGHCFSEDQTDCRNRRWHPLDSTEEAERPGENEHPKSAWVDSVEVLKQTGHSVFNGGRENYQVYNLEVEGHPSYSVNGVIVHNCKKGDKYVGISDFQGIKNKRVRLCGDELAALPKAFVDAIATLDIQGDQKVTGMGNPAQTTDALGLICEPHVSLGGWEGGIDQTPKTKTWKTRFDGGICIQFPGSDSPNMDETDDQTIARGQPKYPFLMSREQLEKDATTWGKDDWHYTMFDEGRMPHGQGSRRVITRQLCLKHHAMEEPVWLNTNLTYITALDAAYRSVGGDRCVLMRLAFGQEATPIDGEKLVEAFVNQTPDGTRYRTILALLDTIVIPIKASDFDSPEDQIVMFVKQKHDQWSLGPDSFFYDAGMRTTLVTAFARLWSPKVNSIDFGGKPPEHRVSGEIEVSCRDYYDRFVTYLWWSSRLTIEADQMRGLSEDLVLEGCAREWKTVGANKIAVETKDEMKLKTGRSPDLYDCLVTGLEGARQKGFVISRLANEDSVLGDNRWKREMLRKAAEARATHQLNYAA